MALALLLASPASAGRAGPALAPAAGEARQALAFARSLFREGDFYRSITELKRTRFLDPGGRLAFPAGIYIGIAYAKSEKYEDAARSFEALIPEFPSNQAWPSLFRAESLLQAAKPEEAEAELRRTFKEKPGPGLGEPSARAAFVLAWTLLAKGQAEAARQQALALAGQTFWGGKSSILAQKAGEMRKIHVRNPAWGGILSAILPGLGQTLGGRPGDGLSALAVNSLFAWGAWESFQQDRIGSGALLTILGTGWYAGNIYAGANTAVRGNREARSSFFAAAWRDAGLPPMEEAYAWPELSEGGP